MKDLNRRIEAVEDRLGSGDDEPCELRVLVSERAFADRESLVAWSKEREQDNRWRGHESIDTLRIVCVSVGEPGVRDCGEMERAPVKQVRS